MEKIQCRRKYIKGRNIELMKTVYTIKIMQQFWASVIFFGLSVC